MIRTLARWAGRAALGIVAAAVLAVAVLHTPPGRNLLRQLVLGLLRRGGIDARLDRLEVRPLRLEASVSGLELRARGAPPFLTLARARLRLPPAALAGRAGLRELEAEGLAVTLERGEDGAFNLPAGGASGDRHLDLRPWLAAAITVRDASIRVHDAKSGADLAMMGLLLEWSGRAGSLEAGAGLIWHWQDRQGHLAVSPIRLESDGAELHVTAPRLQAPEGVLAVDASVTPLFGVPQLRASADGRLEMTPLLGAPWLGAVDLKARADGPVIQPDLDLAATALGLARGSLAVAGSARLQVHGPKTHVDLDARFASGTISAKADLAPEMGSASARWSGFELTSLIGPGARMEGRLAGVFEARWPTPDPARAEVDAQVTVEAARAPSPGRLPVRGRTTLRARNAGYTLALEHTLGEATTVEARLEGRLEVRHLERTTVQGPLRIHATRLGELARAAGVTTLPVRGRLEADLALLGTVASPSVTGALTAHDVTTGEAPGIDAEARLRVAGRTLDLELLEARGGGASARGTLEVSADGRAAGRFEGRISDLALWARVFPPAWSPRGTATFEATVAGPVTEPDLDLRLEGTGVTFLGQPLLSSASARLHVSADELRVDSLILDQGDGVVELSGRLQPRAHRHSLRLEARGFAFHPLGEGVLGAHGLPLRGRLDGRLEVAVDEGRATGSGHLELRDLAFEGRPLGTATVDLTSGGRTLDAEVRLPSLAAAATARMELETPLAFGAELRLAEADLAALARAAGLAEGAVSGTGSLRASLRGEAARLAEATLVIDLTTFEGSAFALPFRLLAPARLRGGPGSVGIEGLRADLGGGRLTADGALEPSGQRALEARFEGGLAGLAALLPRAPGQDAVRLLGEADLGVVVRGTPQAPVPEVRFQVKGGAAARGQTELVHAVDLDASFRLGVLEVARLSGTAHGVHADLTGRAGAGLLVVPLPESLRLVLGHDTNATARLRLEGQPDAKDGEADLAALRALVEMTTDGPSLDRVRATARVEGLQVEIQQVVLHQDQPLTLELAEGRLRIPTSTWRGGRNDLRLGGEVRLAGPGRPLPEARLDLRAEGDLDLRLLNVLGRNVEAGGTARVQASVEGSVQAPQVAGDLRLEGAVLHYRPLRLYLDDVNAMLRAEPGNLAVESLTGTLNGGTLEGGGALTLDGLTLTGGMVGLKARGAALDWPRGLRGTADADLELRGTNHGPVLGGVVTVAGALYKGDPRTLAVPSGPRLAPDEARPAPAALGLDLRLRSLDEVRVDNPFGVFGFSFDVKATGTTAAPHLAGQVELAPGGYVYWSGRRFDLERARLDWNGSSGLLPFVQARATTRVSNYVVTANFSGPVDRADARLASDPPLSTNEITSLLVTGSTRAGAQDSRVVGIASANLLGNLGRVAGLDSVRIDTGDDQSLLNFDPGKAAAETNPAQRLTITKRLTANLEVTVSLNLSESGKTTTFVSYKPRSSLEVRLAQRDDYTGSLELRHDVTFGGGGASPEASSRVVRTARRGKETVASVRIEDDDALDPRPLRPKLGLREGKTFEYEDWQRDRQRLEAAAARRGFAEAYVLARREPRVSPPEGGAVALTYLVRRGPRTAITVTGLPLPESVRREIQRAWSRGDYESSIEDEALLRVRAALVREGFFTPRLRTKLEISADGTRKELLVSGEAGEKAKDRRVHFEGASEVSPERLQDLVRGKDLLAQAWSAPRSLERAVTVLYRHEGYLAAAVEAKEPAVVDGVAVLPVAVEEGPLFTRGTVEVEGCHAVPCAEVLSALGGEPGAPYREAETDAARERLLALYRRRGFGAALVELAGTIDAASARVDVKATLHEGPRQILDEVVVEGGEPATRRALEPLLRFVPGQPVVAEEWAAARKRVYETGLVRGVGLEPVPASSQPAPSPPSGSPEPPPEPIVARLTLDEWPALRLRYGLQLVTEEPLSAGGANSVDLGGTLELSRAILFGHAITTALYGEARTDTWSVRGVFSAPRTFGRALRSSLYLIRDREDLDINLLADTASIQARGNSWEVTLEERFRPLGKLEVALSYDIQWLDVTFPQLRIAPLSFRPARLIATVLVDGRSNILDPKNGFFSSVSTNYADEFLGSEFSFTRTFTQQFGYLPLGKGLLSASGARYERSSGNQSFLTTERLGLGGPTTVRGYDRDTVDLGDILGRAGVTTHVLVLNQELRVPLWGDLRGVAFLDYGELRGHLDGITVKLSRLGTGLGLRYSTAVGVLRFDVGYALKDGDGRPRYYLGLGQSF